VSNFEKHHALVEEAVMELLDKKGYVTSDKIETSAKRLIFNMIARLTEGFISKLSKSVANKDLMPIFKELKEENNTNKAFQIISLAIDLDFPKGLKTDVVKHYNSLEKNYLAQEVILRLNRFDYEESRINLYDYVLKNNDLEKTKVTITDYKLISFYSPDNKTS
jgi:hypothetical protein